MAEIISVIIENRLRQLLDEILTLEIDRDFDKIRNVVSEISKILNDSKNFINKELYKEASRIRNRFQRKLKKLDQVAESSGGSGGGSGRRGGGEGGSERDIRDLSRIARDSFQRVLSMGMSNFGAPVNQMSQFYLYSPKANTFFEKLLTYLNPINLGRNLADPISKSFARVFLSTKTEWEQIDLMSFSDAMNVVADKFENAVIDFQETTNDIRQSLIVASNTLKTTTLFASIPILKDFFGFFAKIRGFRDFYRETALLDVSNTLRANVRNISNILFEEEQRRRLGLPVSKKEIRSRVKQETNQILENIFTNFSEGSEARFLPSMFKNIDQTILKNIAIKYRGRVTVSNILVELINQKVFKNTLGALSGTQQLAESFSLLNDMLDQLSAQPRFRRYVDNLKRKIFGSRNRRGDFEESPLAKEITSIIRQSSNIYENFFDRFFGELTARFLNVRLPFGQRAQDFSFRSLFQRLLGRDQTPVYFHSFIKSFDLQRQLVKGKISLKEYNDYLRENRHLTTSVRDVWKEKILLMLYGQRGLEKLVEKYKTLDGIISNLFYLERNIFKGLFSLAKVLSFILNRIFFGYSEDSFGGLFELLRKRIIGTFIELLRTLNNSINKTFTSVFRKYIKPFVDKSFERLRPMREAVGGFFSGVGKVAGGTVSSLSKYFSFATRILSGFGIALLATAKRAYVAGVAIGTLASVAVGAGLASLYFGVVRPLSQSAIVMEQRFVRLESALQDSIKAVDEYAKAIQYSAKTPFLTSQVSDAVAMLRAFQFDPFEQIDESGRTLLDLLGDMAGAMGTDLETATWALVRAQVAEWEIMQNNFQISARMIPELQGLTSGTKEYGEAIVNFLAKQERFRGGLFKMSMSIQGLTSNIKDFFGIILEYSAGVLDSKSILRGVTFVDEYKKFLSGMYYRVTFTDINKALSDVIGLLSSNEEGMRMLGKTFFRELERMEADSFNFYDSLKKNFNLGDLQFFRSLDVVERFKTMGKRDAELSILSDALKSYGREGALFVGQTYVFGSQITVALGRILGQIASVIMTLFYPIQRFFEKTIEWIKYFTLQILDYFAPIEKIIDSFKSAPADIGKSINEIAEEALTKMGFSVRDLSNANREFAISLSKLVSDEQKRILSATNVLERWVLVFAIVMEFIKLYIKDVYNEMWKRTKKLRDVLFHLGLAIFNILRFVVNLIGKFIGGILSMIHSGILNRFLKNLENVLKRLAIIFGSDTVDISGSLIGFIGKAIGFVLNELLYISTIVVEVLWILLDLLVRIGIELDSIVLWVSKTFTELNNFGMIPEKEREEFEKKEKEIEERRRKHEEELSKDFSKTSLKELISNIKNIFNNNQDIKVYNYNTFNIKSQNPKEVADEVTNRLYGLEDLVIFRRSLEGGS